MRLKKLLFIYNPNSGRGVISIYLLDILKIFDAAGYTTTIYRMKYPGDGAYMAEHESPGYDLLVCAGGDGTLNGIISGIMKVDPEKRPKVGFIPTGSTNDNRKNYKLPANIQHAARVAVNGNPFATDIGLCNDRYFTYVASFGELSAVSCFTPQANKNLLGHAAYIPEGIKALWKMRSQKIAVTYDGDNVVKGDYFLGMVTNAVSVGGFSGVTGTNVDLQDGLFEIMLFQKPADILDLQKEVTAVLSSGTADGLITRIKASKITFDCDEEMQWVVDGENGGQHKHTEIINCNRAVCIMSGLTSKNR